MKNKLLLMPLVMAALSTVGCKNYDYKYDDPNAVIRNRYGDVYFTYPLETASDYKRFPLQDKGKIVINGLKKTKTFEKVDEIKPTTDRSVEFTVDHYLAKEVGALSIFNLYADGSLSYSLYNVNKRTTERYAFTMDAGVAKEIIDKAYERFEEVKKYEEDYLSKINIENYLDICATQKILVFYGLEEGGDRRYYDDGRVYNAFKNLKYTYLWEGEMPEDYGSDYSREPVSFIPMGDEKYNVINFEGGVVYYWRLYISKGGKYVRMYFSGRDSYSRSFYFQKYYSIDPEQGKAIIKMVEELAK